MSDIKFFGEVDLHPTKKFISSEYPAWYFDRPLANLEEDIRKLEKTLERKDVPADKLIAIRERLTSLKDRYVGIMEFVPRLSGDEVDKLAKTRKEMAKIIQSGLYPRSQMQKGTVDAHKEVERMISPKIAVRPEFAELIQACNVKITDGKITRDGLIKAWKMTGKLLNRHGGDEETNVEVLRKD